MKNSLVIDSNLLLLYVVGATSLSYIKSHKKLSSYTAEDYQLLLSLISKADRVLVTPNTLTETSNLVGFISNPARDQIMRNLRGLIQSADEIYRVSKEIIGDIEFIRLGLTDITLLGIEDENCTLLTSDLGLFLAAVGRGKEAINFNHVRDLAYSATRD